MAVGDKRASSSAYPLGCAALDFYSEVFSMLALKNAKARARVEFDFDTSLFPGVAESSVE
jgi:hypothetical protein